MTRDLPLTRDDAVRIIRRHGHVVPVVEADHIVAECECVFPGGRVAIEYQTFMAPFSARVIRDWLGY